MSVGPSVTWADASILLVCALAVAWAVLRGRWLTAGGAAAATGVGGLVYLGEGAAGLLLLLVCFATSSALTALPDGSPNARSGKPPADLEGRTAAQVVANGGVAAAAASLGVLGLLTASGYAVAGALAAATGDTWATEVGRRYGGRPRRIAGWTRVGAGAPGGITPLGTGAALAGAALLAGLGAWVYPEPASARLLPIGLAAGAVGTLADTLAGTYLEPRFSGIGNDAVNLIGTSVGAAVGWALGAGPLLGLAA